MSTTTITGAFGTLRIERAMVDVTSSAPRVDRAWTHTDEQGHEHRWNDGWPTLRWVVDEPADDEFPAEGHWECAACGENVNPGMRPAPPFRELIPAGPIDYYLNDEPITEDEARALVEDATR